MTIWKDKRLGGYSGLKHTAEKINKLIPKCKIYCEPFAGLARVAELGVNCDEIVLNDKSEFAVNYLRENFSDDTVRSFDWKKCMELYDSEDTFFLIDPPYYRNIYKNNNMSFIDREPLEYYKQLLDLLPTIKGNWILCSTKHREMETLLKITNYYRTEILSEKNSIFGKKSRITLTSNIPFYKHGFLTLTHNLNKEPNEIKCLKCGYCNITNQTLEVFPN